MLLASTDHRQKTKHPAENLFQQSLLGALWDNVKTRNYWPEPQLCSVTQRTYGGCLNICWELREDSLSCIAQCSNVIPSSERPACVYLVTTLWPNAKHMPLSNAFWCAHVQAFEYWNSNTILMPFELFSYGQRGLSLHSTGNRINTELDKPNTKK